MSTPKDKFVFPKQLLSLMAGKPAESVFPGTADVNNDRLGCLYLNCSQELLDFFNIKEGHPIEPLFKFRMMNYQHLGYLIELELHFEERIMKIHLDPIHVNVKGYLINVLKSNKMAVVFYNMNTEHLAIFVAGLDEEHLDWVSRNLGLALSLKQNLPYKLICEMVYEKMRPNERKLDFNGSIKENYSFIGPGVQVVEF